MTFTHEREEYSDVFDKEFWESKEAMIMFTPDDGIGYWGTEYFYSADHDCFDKAPEGATHVHWYNA